MDNQSPNTLITQSTVPPKEVWTKPVLRKTPIAETAGSKDSGLPDGFGGFGS